MNILLKQARRQAGLTQEQLANAIGTTVMSIWRWEAGQTPSNFFRQLICDYFSLSSAELGWSDPTGEEFDQEQGGDQSSL